MSIILMCSVKNFYSVYLKNRTLSKSVLAEKDAIACGLKVASEAITNIRTVASLSKPFNKCH